MLFPGELNKEVEITFDGNAVKKMTLIQNNPNIYSQLDLSPPVRSKSMKVKVLSVYRRKNNGFQEIRVWKQEGLNFMF